MLASLLISALATTAHALPHLGARQTTDPYAGIAGGRATLPGPFTLAALNTTLPNANSTGAPLVLGSGGAITGAAFYILSTYASYPYNDHPSVSLTDGGLDASGAVSGVVLSNGFPGFVQTWPRPVPPPVYCAAPSAQEGGLDVLAANGHTDKFSICPYYSQRAIVYNATEDREGVYRLEECLPVVIQIVPQ